MNGDNGRDRRISIRVSREELERIRENAAACGMPVAGYLRSAGTGTLKRQKESGSGAKRAGAGDLELLRNFSLLSSLDEEELFQSLDKIRVKKFVRNETVLIQEDANLFMYVILAGAVKVIRVSEEGKEIILAMHRTGDFFGEMSLIDGKTASATVVAMEDSSIAIISKDDFYSLIYSQKKILLLLLQTFCRRIRVSNATMEIMSRTSASQRVKMLLLLLCGKHGKKEGRGFVLSIQLTHQDMAGMTGLTRETVTKIMNELKNEGAIEALENRRIRLNESFFTPAGE